MNSGNVKYILTDGGGKYVFKSLDKLLRKEGMVHELTTSYSPESNGKYELLNRTLLYSSRAILIGLNLKRK